MHTLLRDGLPCAALALALSLNSPASHADGNEIVLGASVQLTGPVANTGRYYKDAYQLAVDQLNRKGGVDVGGKKYTLALKIYDNQSDVNLSVRQYTQLISRDKVNFLLGPFASNFALADSAVSEKYQIPMAQGGAPRTRSSRAGSSMSSAPWRRPATISAARSPC